MNLGTRVLDLLIIVKTRLLLGWLNVIFGLMLKHLGRLLGGFRTMRLGQATVQLLDWNSIGSGESTIAGNRF